MELAHTKLDVFRSSRQLVLECYRLTKQFPADERFNMISQIRRAALSVHLNIAEGSARRTEADRKRFYEIARGCVIEIDTVLDLARDLDYCKSEHLSEVGENIIKSFKMLTGLISATAKQ